MMRAVEKDHWIDILWLMAWVPFCRAVTKGMELSGTLTEYSALTVNASATRIGSPTKYYYICTP